MVGRPSRARPLARPRASGRASLEKELSNITLPMVPLRTRRVRARQRRPGTNDRPVSLEGLDPDDGAAIWGCQHSRGVAAGQIPAGAPGTILGIVDGELLEEAGGTGPVASVKQFHPPGEAFAELLVGGPDGLAPADDFGDLDWIGLARQHERSERADEQHVESPYRRSRSEQARGEQLVHVLDARSRIGRIPHRLQFAGDGTEANLARIEADARGHPLRNWMRRVETIDGVSYFNLRK